MSIIKLISLEVQKLIVKKLILFLILVAFLSGCSTSDTSKVYSNNVISLEYYSISSLNPYAGSTTKIEFEVMNKGTDPINDVEIDFFDLPGFTILGLECQLGQKKDDHTCLFDSLESLDSKRVNLNLQAPGGDFIKAPTKFTISYSVKYKHSGFRQANIPIVDGITLTQPKGKYVASTPSYGPISVEFSPPVGRETKTGKQTVKEYWGVKGNAFEMKMSFKDVGDSSGIQKVPTTISANDITIKLESLVVAENAPCSFEGSTSLTAEEDLIVPVSGSKSLTCNFKSTDFREAERLGTVQVSFNYVYKFLKSETFTIYPLE
jgi:hypothetical protein